MSIAAKWGDLVIGVDVHMVMVPAPPSPIPVPTPMPHAFMGVVYDPLGATLAAGISGAGGGGAVLINWRPVGNTGTDVRGEVHTPTLPGVSFAPNDIPDNKGTIVTGSKTVSMGGSSAGRLTSMVMSCNYPVNLPTSICMALPMGAPVLVGGPDSFDVMAAVTRGIRTKWFSNKLHQIFKIKPGTRLSKAICFLTGHLKEMGFDGRRLEFWYDQAGRCRESVNAAGKRTKIERDALGRVVKLRVPGPVPLGKVLPGIEEIEYGYNALGQLVRAKNGACEVVFERDALGRVMKERAGDSVIESRYDAGGHRVRRTTSLGHETVYDVDGNGVLRGLSFGLDPRWHDFSPERLSTDGPPLRAPWKVAIGRDVLGNETDRALPGKVVSRWERDRFGRPAVRRVLHGEEQVSAVGYRWRSDEQVAALIDTQEGPTHFTHDARSCLVAATGPYAEVQYRALDAVGNVYRSSDRSDRSYGPGGRLKEAAGTMYVHDADGQVVEKVLPDGQRWKYLWDGQGQLLEVVRPDGRKVTFAYDALGRRVRKAFGRRTTAYVWDGNDLVHEITDGAELVTWEMDPATFAPLAKVEGEKRYGVVTDHLGTPKALFDEAGEIAWKAQLDLYGIARTDVMRTGCPWRWPGQYEDEETGLYYNRFRYYDPEAGRYISQDPIGLEGGLALFGYVTDPLVWIDPYGLTFRGPARKSTDWKHIFEGHWYGSPPISLGNNDVFGRLSKAEITQVVNEAWRLRRSFKHQPKAIGYHAFVKNRLWTGIIEMWQDRATGELSSAYPMGKKSRCK